MKIDKDKLIEHIINWLDSSIDEYDKEKDYYDYKNQLAMDSQDLKEKINSANLIIKPSKKNILPTYTVWCLIVSCSA